MPKKRTAGEQLTDAMYYVLLALGEPLHGYAIIRKIEELSQGTVRLTTVTLYTTLAAHEQDGFVCRREDIVYEKDTRRKYYQITEKGREVALRECIRRRNSYLHGVRALREMGCRIDEEI